MLKGLGGLGDMAAMMKAAQDLQGKMASLQEDMARIIVIGESGGGAIVWSGASAIDRPTVLGTAGIGFRGTSARVAGGMATRR